MKRKVLFITSSLSKGGAETQLIKLAVFLKSLNFEVSIISLKAINEFEIDYEKEGIPVLFIDHWYRNPLKNLQTIYTKIKSFKPDVVIAFMFVAILFARFYKLLLKYKLISSVRIGVLPTKWYLPYLLSNGLDDVLIYNSYASKLNFEKILFADKNGLVINNGISIPNLQDCHIVKADSEQFVWVCLAHFRWNKDYNTLFKAVQLLKGFNFRVDIIGEYTLKNSPLEYIKSLNISSHVNVLGFKQNVSQYLKSADAFVLSSFSEGMPNALLEAMAFCKPVVVSDIDCNAEILDVSRCGFLFGCSNEHDLAKKMIDMMNLSQEQRMNLGMRGRSYIQNHFAEKKVMNSWLNLINQYSKNRELILLNNLQRDKLK
jgi:glycosyltransferase involved in cell wall biosynthesis